MNTHNKSIEQLKKMSTSQLLALYVEVLGRQPSELLSDRQSLIIVLYNHSVAAAETEQNHEAADRFAETQKKIVRLQVAEQNAPIPGWKRDWIRRLRNGGHGASWNQIEELTGVSTNVCSAIVNQKIYRWDHDISAKVTVILQRKNLDGLLASCGIVRHEEHDLDRYFVS